MMQVGKATACGCLASMPEERWLQSLISGDATTARVTTITQIVKAIALVVSVIRRRNGPVLTS
jgi:hypothetical protein